MFQKKIRLPHLRQGLHDITSLINETITEKLPQQGLLNCFLPHTSASLLIQENADPTAKQDLESFIQRLIPDGEPWHRHTIEGPDDTTSHMKSAITQTSLNIPIIDGQLGLGTWQGIYLWEHRKTASQRNLIITLL